MFDQALGLFDHHFRDLDVANRRLVESRGNDLASDRPLHVGHFLRPLVDQQDDQITLRVICRDRLRDILQQDRLSGSRRRHDQRALPFADRRNDVDHPRGKILASWILDFQAKPLMRVQGRQIVEMHLVTSIFRLLEIDGVASEESEITLSFLRAANHALDSVAGSQAQSSNSGKAKRRCRLAPEGNWHRQISRTRTRPVIFRRLLRP